MDTTTRAASPLRQRMIEDMRMRRLESRTQEGYIRAVRKLTAYLMRSPDTATVDREKKRSSMTVSSCDMGPWRLRRGHQ